MKLGVGHEGWAAVLLAEYIEKKSQFEPRLCPLL